MRAIWTSFAYLSLSALWCAGLSCAPSSSNSPSTASKTGGAASSSAGVEQVKLQGAGASFPAPLYNKWFKTYGATHPGVQIDYQSVGSGGGVKALLDKTVDFGASDAAMTPEEIQQVKAGVQLLPLTAGSIVLAYNLEGVEELQLSRAVYAGIFLGQITDWNDPKIVADNPGVKLPERKINVIVRADSSGTTFVFTKHLSAISEEFAKSPGVNKMPNWAVGTKSKGNEGVSASLAKTPDSIGYIEFGYARGAKLKTAKLQNKAGKFVAATSETAQASLASVEMPEDLVAWLSDPEGEGSYPIVTYTWLLCYKKYDTAQKAETLKSVVTYAVTEGQQDSESLGFVALPSAVVEKVKAALANIQGPAGK